MTSHQKKQLAPVLCLVSSVLAFTFFGLGYSAVGFNLVAILFALIAVFAGNRWAKDRKGQERLRELESNWGEAVIERERDFDAYRDYVSLNQNGADEALDEQSWNDLNLDDIYELIDRTESLPGALVLYDILRRPVRDQEILKQRSQLIQSIKADPKQCAQLRLALRDVRHVGSGPALLSILWTTNIERKTLTTALLLSLAAVASLFSIAIIGPYSIFVIFGLFLYNMKWHYQIREQDQYFLGGLSELRNLLQSAEAVIKAKTTFCPDLMSQLASLLERCRRIQWKLRLVKPHLGPISEIPSSLFEYVSIFFLLELQAFLWLNQDLRELRKDLKDLFRVVGELDALQSLASFHCSLSRGSKPEFHETLKLEIEDLYHPLLEGAVANSLTIERGMILTGSNMAGKSTFLRSLGISAVLAQTAVISPSARYRAPLFRFRSSISPSDDLSEGKSFFHAEAESLLKIYHEAKRDSPSLLLIDEILKGTNSTERLAAAEEILRDIQGEKSMVFVATHDVGLAEALTKGYDCYHFTDQQQDGGRSFDYLLKKGIVQTTNALTTLQSLGFPEEIISKARKKVEDGTRSSVILG